MYPTYKKYMQVYEKPQKPTLYFSIDINGVLCITDKPNTLLYNAKKN